MSLGEPGADTLGIAEQDFLGSVAASDFPEHSFSVVQNDVGMSWVVIEPFVARPGILRFTICRVDPSVMVLIEDHGTNRRFCSAPDVEHAATVIRNAADHAVLNAMNAHPASAVLQ